MIALLQQEEKLTTTAPRFYYKTEYDSNLTFSETLGNANLLYFKSSLPPTRAVVGLLLLHKIIDEDEFNPESIVDCWREQSDDPIDVCDPVAVCKVLQPDEPDEAEVKSLSKPYYSRSWVYTLDTIWKSSTDFTSQHLC
jgi:hypothetical protein